MSETKWYKVKSKLKVLVIKNFHNLLPNLVECQNKRWLQFQPFCMNKSLTQNFGMVQNWEILDLVMVKVEKINITVTYYCQPSFFMQGQSQPKWSTSWFCMTIWVGSWALPTNISMEVTE